jgi:hypothetical protein
MLLLFKRASRVSMTPLKTYSPVSTTPEKETLPVSMTTAKPSFASVNDTGETPHMLLDHPRYSNLKLINSFNDKDTEPICLRTCLFLNLSVSEAICIRTYLFLNLLCFRIYLFPNSFVSKSICFQIYLFPNLSVSESICFWIFQFPNLSVSEPICIRIYLFPNLSVSESSLFPNRSPQSALSLLAQDDRQPLLARPVAKMVTKQVNPSKFGIFQVRFLSSSVSVKLGICQVWSVKFGSVKFCICQVQ